MKVLYNLVRIQYREYPSSLLLRQPPHSFPASSIARRIVTPMSAGDWAMCTLADSRALICTHKHTWQHELLPAGASYAWVIGHYASDRNLIVSKYVRRKLATHVNFWGLYHSLWAIPP